MPRAPKPAPAPLPVTASDAAVTPSGSDTSFDDALDVLASAYVETASRTPVPVAANPADASGDDVRSQEDEPQRPGTVLSQSRDAHGVALIVLAQIGEFVSRNSAVDIKLPSDTELQVMGQWVIAHWARVAQERVRLWAPDKLVEKFAYRFGSIGAENGRRRLASLLAHAQQSAQRRDVWQVQRDGIDLTVRVAPDANTGLLVVTELTFGRPESNVREEARVAATQGNELSVAKSLAAASGQPHSPEELARVARFVTENWRPVPGRRRLWPSLAAVQCFEQAFPRSEGFDAAKRLAGLLTEARPNERQLNAWRIRRPPMDISFRVAADSEAGTDLLIIYTLNVQMRGRGRGARGRR